ncbi:uncharacterized protein LOC124692166 isoform X1 [Lolium rigidum]|uniref:uncharacterized protein LOC124692166 isoform X1 n=1 Tax=Lolium rigidum TaxID=89674 RepID=UPI001F5D2B91|nr:uncharacterized protein LOC124692166 isoform X1 [Lolium rigidum]
MLACWDFHNGFRLLVGQASSDRFDGYNGLHHLWIHITYRCLGVRSTWQVGTYMQLCKQGSTLLSSMRTSRRDSSYSEDVCFRVRERILLRSLRALPEGVEAYRQICATSAVESEQLAQSLSVLPNGDPEVKAELLPK